MQDWIDEYKNFKIYDTTHSLQRRGQRSVIPEPIIYLYSQAIDFIIQGKGRNVPIFIYLKTRYRQSIVLSYRKEKNIKEINIITILPLGQHKILRKNTQKVIVERLAIKQKFSKSFLEYISGFIQLTSKTKTYDYYPVSKFGLEFIFVNNELDNVLLKGFNRLGLLEVK